MVWRLRSLRSRYPRTTDRVAGKGWKQMPVQARRAAMFL